MKTFAHPPRPPSPFSFRSADASFSIYRWRVSIDRAAPEFAELDRASARGFTLRGSGSADVTTPPVYRRRKAYKVTVGGHLRRVTSDRHGRLHFRLTLATGHSLAVRIS
jgi:hypothetical protein